MTAAARPPRDGLSIGAVLAQLRSDFPDITISKIRFLEAEGLISPARTDSGYRQFTTADVQRLRFVLAAQRDHYLPLKVIREQLAAADLHAARPARPLVAVAEPVPPACPPVPDGPVTRDELVAAADIDSALLAELEQFGLVSADTAGRFAPDAVAVATTVRCLGEYGIEPRHLRAFRSAADREVGLLSQVVAPLLRNRDPATRARAEEIGRQLTTLSVTLHTLLVRAGLRATVGG